MLLVIAKLYISSPIYPCMYPILLRMLICILPLTQKYNVVLQKKLLLCLCTCSYSVWWYLYLSLFSYYLSVLAPVVPLLKANSTSFALLSIDWLLIDNFTRALRNLLNSIMSQWPKLPQHLAMQRPKLLPHLAMLIYSNASLLIQEFLRAS